MVIEPNRPMQICEHRSAAWIYVERNNEFVSPGSNRKTGSDLQHGLRGNLKRKLQLLADNGTPDNLAPNRIGDKKTVLLKPELAGLHPHPALYNAGSIEIEIVARWPSKQMAASVDTSFALLKLDDDSDSSVVGICQQ